MGKIDFSEVKKEVSKIVIQITEVSEDTLTEEAKFAEDLGVDSMMALEIIASIEKKYKIVIPEAEIPRIRCLKDVYGLLEKVMK